MNIQTNWRVALLFILPALLFYVTVLTHLWQHFAKCARADPNFQAFQVCFHHHVDEFLVRCGGFPTEFDFRLAGITK